MSGGWFTASGPFPRAHLRVQAVAEDCFSQALASDDGADEADGSDSGFPEASSSSTSPIQLKKKASAAAGKPARPQPAKTPKQGKKTERVGVARRRARGRSGLASREEERAPSASSLLGSQAACFMLAAKDDAAVLSAQDQAEQANLNCVFVATLTFSAARP